MSCPLPRDLRRMSCLVHPVIVRTLGRHCVLLRQHLAARIPLRATTTAMPGNFACHLRDASSKWTTAIADRKDRSCATRGRYGDYSIFAAVSPDRSDDASLSCQRLPAVARERCCTSLRTRPPSPSMRHQMLDGPQDVPQRVSIGRFGNKGLLPLGCPRHPDRPQTKRHRSWTLTPVPHAHAVEGIRLPDTGIDFRRGVSKQRCPRLRA